MYWPERAVDCYTTVVWGPAFPKNRIQLRKNVRQLHLFPSTAPLEPVAIHVLSEVIKSTCNIQYLLITSDRSTKLTGSVLLKNFYTPKVAKTVVIELVSNYGPPKNYLPKQNMFHNEVLSGRLSFIEYS